LQQSLRTISFCSISGGCLTFFDTAEIYVKNLEPQNKGHNEKIVGKAIKDFRKNIVLATKLSHTDRRG